MTRWCMAGWWFVALAASVVSWLAAAKIMGWW
jgi:hypothetical protein